MVLLSELTAIPPIANSMNLFEDGLKAAAKILANQEPWLASYLAIRIETSDKLLDDVFSRTRVARLPDHLIALLREALSRRVHFALTHIGDPPQRNRDALVMLASSLELLSRVSVRLSPDILRVLFEDASAYYGSQRFRRMSFHLGLPLAHLMARVLESLPRHDLIDLLVRLFQLPLPGAVGVDPDDNRWHDPVMLIPDWFKPDANDLTPRAPAWDIIVAQLLLAAKNGAPQDRRAAVLRLRNLYHWKILTEEEDKAFAVAVWTPQRRDKFGLPGDANLRPWVFLTLPEEKPGQAKDALLHFVEEQSRQDGQALSERLAEVGAVLRHFVDRKIEFDLSEDAKLAPT